MLGCSTPRCEWVFAWTRAGSTHISAQFAPRSATVACGSGRLSCDATTSRRNFSSGCPVSAMGNRKDKWPVRYGFEAGVDDVEYCQVWTHVGVNRCLLGIIPVGVRNAKETGHGQKRRDMQLLGLGAWPARTGEEDGKRVAIAAEFEVLADQLVQKQLVVGERRPHVVLSVAGWVCETSAWVGA